MSNEKIKRILGIDLGTTNSAAAVVIGGKPTIIPSAEGATVAGRTCKKTSYHQPRGNHTRNKTKNGYGL